MGGSVLTGFGDPSGSRHRFTIDVVDTLFALVIGAVGVVIGAAAMLIGQERSARHKSHASIPVLDAGLSRRSIDALSVGLIVLDPEDLTIAQGVGAVE